MWFLVFLSHFVLLSVRKRLLFFNLVFIASYWSHGNSNNEKQPWKDKKDKTWILTDIFLKIIFQIVCFICFSIADSHQALHHHLCILLLLIVLYSTIPFAVFFQCVLVFVVIISSCSEIKNDSASPKGAVSSSNLSLRNFRQMCHFASETLERAFKAILEKCENKSKCECHKRESFA